MGCSGTKEVKIKEIPPARKRRLSVSSNMEAFIKEYQIEEKLFEKESEKIFLVKHLISGQQRIMRSIKSKIIKNQSEIDQMAALDHPNLVKTYEYFIDNNSYHIITEYLEGGKLQDKLEKVQFFNEKNASKITQQLFSAIAYLHENRITFQNLTCSSIYFESPKEGNYNIKLLYLGHSLYNAKNNIIKQIKADPVYLAPESHHKKIYNDKSDVWSLGVILYMLLCGYPPFKGKDRTDTLEKVVIGKYSLDSHDWDNISNEAKDLVKKALIYDNSKRASAKECLKHQWLTKFRSKEQKQFPILRINTLTVFQKMKTFHKAIVEYLIHQNSTDKNYNNLKKIFQELDSDGKGYLSYDDMKKAWKNTHSDEAFCDKEFDNYFKLVDLKGDKIIEYQEFLRVTVNYEELLSEKNLLKAFKFLDKTDSGFISVDDIKNSLHGHDAQENEELAIELLREIDIMATDKISFEEFKQIVKELKKNKSLMDSIRESNN